jgi:adenylate cyclase class 2
VITEKKLEVEIKVRVSGPESWRRKVLALPAVPRVARGLERNIVFDTRQGDLKREGILLRLRQQGGRALLTLKQPAGGDSLYKVREETEVRVSNFAAAEKIMRAIGLQAVFIYEKYREVLQAQGTQLMIDETPIGTFIEIEGPPERIDAVAARLGFSSTDYLRDSYYQLFLRSGGTGHMVFAR